MDNYSLYIHTNKANGKQYVGITNNIKHRWCKGCNYKSSKRFYSAIKHYGWENFDHEVILSGLSKEEAEAKEIEYIEKLNTKHPNGYNLSGGGGLSNPCEETREKLRNRKFSPESLEKISRASKDRWDNDPEFRRKNEEHLRRLAQANRGRKKTEEEIQAIIKHTCKPIDQLSMDGEYIQTFPSISEAGRAIGGSNSLIARVVNKPQYSAYGYKWRYTVT